MQRVARIQVVASDDLNGTTVSDFSIGAKAYDYLSSFDGNENRHHMYGKR